jgi:L-ribulose-5-phosphate 4-epimerase
MLTNEGYIKYHCELVLSEPENFSQFSELNELRTILWHKKLIGMSEGVGFGNLSVRINSSQQFFITGSATGKIEDLQLKHYAKVIAYDFATNSLKCTGEIKASSEALTHAAIYETDPDCNVVVHIHSSDLWLKWLHQFPTTPAACTFGTQELAYAIEELFLTSDLKRQKIIVLGGHRDGLVLFDNTIAMIKKRLQDIED